MPRGIVKWYDPNKGYGFIQQDAGPDIFVHISAVERAGLNTLDTGQQVEFAVAHNRGRTCAENLKTG